MTDDREPYGRVSHAIYRDWLAEQVQRVYGDVAQMGSWEDLTGGMREAYMRIGAAVAAVGREPAEARLAEIREVIATYFVVHGNSNAASLTHARDLAEGIRQILDRKEASGGLEARP